MKIKKTEYHQVNSEFTYDIPDEDIIAEFGSTERFAEIVSHNCDNDWKSDPQGDPPTDEEQDKFWDFVNEYDYDREDDWWTDNKGGYEVDYEVIGDDDE